MNPFQNVKLLHKTTISRKSKEIQIGFIEIEPTLENVLTAFLREHSKISKTDLKGGTHDIVRKAREYWNLKGDQDLCLHIMKNYKEQLEGFLTPREIKQSMCHMF